MNHSDILKSVAKEFELKPQVVDKIIECYFWNAARATQKDLDAKRKELGEEATITRSASIVNKAVGTIWTKYDKGTNGENALGGVEKALYPRLKVRFSKKFVERAFVDPNPLKEEE